MKKLLAILVVGLLALLPAAALAQVGATGTGTVTAEGSGRAALVGSGSVQISGSGVLRIVDRAGDAVINVQGNGTRETQTLRGQQVVVYRGFDGTAYISGSGIAVELRGREIALSAEGTGTVRLRGSGTYMLNGTQGGEWSATGVTLELNGSPASNVVPTPAVSTTPETTTPSSAGE